MKRETEKLSPVTFKGGFNDGESKPADFVKLGSLRCDPALPKAVSESLDEESEKEIRVPYALRRVPAVQFTSLLPCPPVPKPGDIFLARLEKISKTAKLELASGRLCTFHEGDLLMVVFGNRYATVQFEGYARANGDACDLLSMGGVCGLVESKHVGIPDPNKLRLIGAVGNSRGHSLNLRDFSLPPALAPVQVRTVVVCGSSMDAGKTHTAMSLIVGLQKDITHVAGIKLTGTAAGKDTWNMLDAGACSALNFIDGGFASTYLSTLNELLDLHHLLVNHAVLKGAEFVVIEIADGLLQEETAALLQNPSFVEKVDAWVFAAGDPLAASAGVRLLRQWGIEPVAVTGKVSMSPLCIREAETAVGLDCFTAKDLQAGKLNKKLLESGRTLYRPALKVSPEKVAVK